MKTYHGASSALCNLQKVAEEREKDELDLLVAAAEAEVQGCIDKPWKVIPEVTAFEAQFADGVKLKGVRFWCSMGSLSVGNQSLR